MTRIVTATEIPDVLAEAGRRLANSFVGFVRVMGEEDDAVLAGSGTLVTAGGRHAILTADHVSECLPKRGEFGLILLTTGAEPRTHRFRLDAARITRIRVGPASMDEYGPDLALIVLGAPDIARLQATMAFYNLDKRREYMLSTPKPIADGGWLLAGIADEWTTDLPKEKAFTRVKGFRGLYGAGVVTKERDSGAFDYLDYEAKYDSAYEGPNSYQGCSGGGLWQIRMRESGDSVEIVDALLSGVAFYQSAVQGDIRTIYCHGRRSIYEHVHRQLSAT